MATSQKKQDVGIRVGKKLRLSVAQLEKIAAMHDRDQRGSYVERPAIAKLNDLIRRFPASPAVPPCIAIPLTKRDYSRLKGVAKESGLDVESLVTTWIRQRLARCS
jgi:hypothetical protein